MKRKGSILTLVTLIQPTQKPFAHALAIFCAIQRYLNPKKVLYDQLTHLKERFIIFYTKEKILSISSIQFALQSTYEIAVRVNVNSLGITRSNTRVEFKTLMFDLVFPRELTLTLTAISQVLCGANYILLLCIMVHITYMNTCLDPYRRIGTSS